jgi:hypothetical protein
MKLAAAVVSVALVVSCHYEWTVGPSQGGEDAGDGDDGGGGGDGGQLVDAAGGGDGQGTQCDVLNAQLGIAYSQILRCNATCAQSVKNECGCDTPVEDASSPAAQNYAKAAKAYADAGCATKCSACKSWRHECLVGFGNVCS